MTPVEALSALRATIADLKLQIATIEEQPFSRSEVETLLRAHAANAAAEGERTLGYRVQAIDSVEDVLPLLKVRISNGWIDLAPLLGAVLGAKALGNALARMAAGVPEGLTATNRRETLARLHAETLAAELDEEQAVRDLLAAGFNADRRADADPRAVLALP